MRVTNSMMITNMLANLSKNLNNMSRKQDELSTGKKVIFASDNPVAAAKIMKFKTDIADMYQYNTNIRDGKAWLDASEASIAEAGQVLQRVRELMVQSANGTNTPDDLLKINEEVVQLKGHLISGANANFAGRYLFSSHFTDKAVLDKNGDYNIPITTKDTIDPDVMVYEVSIAERMKIGTHAYSYLRGAVDTSAFATGLPTAVSTDGVGAQKPVTTATFNFTQDFSGGANIEVTYGGKTFLVDKSKLKGSATKPLTSGEVLNAFNSAQKTAPAPLTPVELLSVNADVFIDPAGATYDANGQMISGTLTIKGKLSGAGATQTVGLTAVTGISGITPTPGADRIEASVTSTTALTNADAATFAGKKFLFTSNGVTKEISIPDTPVQATVAGLVTQLQGLIDNTTSGFGPNKIIVSAPGGFLKFETDPTATVPSDMTKPVIQVEAVTVKTPKLIQDMNNFIANLNAGNHIAISNSIGEIDEDINNLLAVRADIGARGNRLDLIDTRISENNISFTRLLSDAQDADMAEVIMNLKNSENVYKSALAVGGKIIQPSLLDFLR